MDAAMIVVAAAAVAALASIGIAFVALSRFRRVKVGGDADAASTGGTGTVRSYRSGGSVSWESFFDPDSQESDETRSTATYAIIGFYVVAGAVTVVIAYMGVAWGYCLGLLVVGYATLIIGVNYVKARRRKSGEAGKT